jgi:hypothetical protein
MPSISPKASAKVPLAAGPNIGGIVAGVFAFIGLLAAGGYIMIYKKPAFLTKGRKSVPTRAVKNASEAAGKFNTANVTQEYYTACGTVT